MTRNTDTPTARRGLFSVCLVVLSAVAMPAWGESLMSSYECSMAQVRSPMGSKCVEEAEKDIMKKAPKWHILYCKGSDLLCCLTDTTKPHGPLSDCKVVGQSPSTPPAEVACSALKSAKGVWTPDPKSIKANPDKNTCSQVYICNPPLPKELTESQNKCTAFVSVSNKQVTMQGTCVPGSKPGTCSSCLGNPPNDPCTVSFRK